MISKNKKPLVAYFSKSGNTETIAKIIHELTEGDIYHIETVKSYPVDYKQTTEVAKKELRTNDRPKLKEHELNISKYDIIFLGYPNWWGTMPMAVYTFLESQDFSETTIIPFCTHGGGGVGKSVQEIRECCPKANVGEVLSIYGRRKTKSDIEKWLKNLKQIKMKII